LSFNEIARPPLSAAYGGVIEAQHHYRRFTMNVAPLESPLASSPLMNGIMGVDNALSLGLGSPGIGSDAIARFVAPQTAQTAAGGPEGSLTGSLESSASQMYNPLGSMLAQLMQMMQTLMSSLGISSGNGSSYPPGYGTGSSGCPQYGNEQYYTSATGASQGDPHLSFNGNTWDNMTSQPNLLQSNSFPGGYQISTQVTPPSARGIAYNQSATIAMNGGATTIALNNQGQASIQEYGQNVPISPGQTVQLGNGENVTCNNNGSLTVQAQNGNGGQITTTLTQLGQGVNVKVNAQNVDLGGSLVTGNQMQPGTQTNALTAPSALPFPAQMPPLLPPSNPFQQQQQQPYAI
jgi:hypothetical protein